MDGNDFSSAVQLEREKSAFNSIKVPWERVKARKTFFQSWKISHEVPCFLQQSEFGAFYKTTKIRK